MASGAEIDLVELLKKTGVYYIKDATIGEKCSETERNKWLRATADGLSHCKTLLRNEVCIPNLKAVSSFLTHSRILKRR